MRQLERKPLSGTSRSNHFTLTKRYHLLYTSFLMMLQPLSASGTITQCQAMAVSRDKGTITCIYPLDLNQTKKSFCLIQYGGDNKRTDVVTACSWEDAELLCVFEDGFRFHQPNITNTFTVELPVHKGIGAFSCDTIPPDMSVTVEKCTLPLTTVFNTDGIGENVSTTKTADPCTRRPIPDRDKCYKGRPVYIAFIVVLSLVNLVLIIAVVRLYLRIKLLNQRLERGRVTFDVDTNADVLQDGTGKDLCVQNGLLSSQTVRFELLQHTKMAEDMNRPSSV